MYTEQEETHTGWHDALSHSVAQCPGTVFCPKEPSLESDQIIPIETAAVFILNSLSPVFTLME